MISAAVWGNPANLVSGLSKYRGRPRAAARGLRPLDPTHVPSIGHMYF